MGFLSVIKKHTPWPVRLLSRRVRRRIAYLTQPQRSPREVFSRIYAENLWGTGKPVGNDLYAFYSGPGSEESAARPYADCVRRFIEEQGIRSVVDLGCGDFRVGRLIANPGIDYIGVDIVEPVITENTARFSSERIQFRCLDVIADAIPDGELILLREVLQHLSNEQVVAILAKLRKFRWVIVTEVHPGPPGSFKPNRNKPHGADSRAMWNSGIVLNAPPFNVCNVELLLSLPAVQSEGDPAGACLNSFLVRN